MMNKILWTYILKKTSNDEEKTIETQSIWTTVAARTKISDNDGVSKLILQMVRQSYFNHGQGNLFTTTEATLYYHQPIPSTNIHNYASLAWVSGRKLYLGISGMTELNLFVLYIDVPTSLDIHLSVFLLLNQVFLFEVFAKMQ